MITAVTESSGKFFYKKFTLSKQFAAKNQKLIQKYSALHSPRRRVKLRKTKGRKSNFQLLIQQAREAVFGVDSTFGQALRPLVAKRVAQALLRSASPEVRQALRQQKLTELAELLSENVSDAQRLLFAKDINFISSSLFTLCIVYRRELSGAKEPLSTKNAQKLQSRGRLEKMVFILNALNEQGYLSSHQLLQQMNVEFAQNGEPRVDRKTVERMNAELVELGLIRIKRFLVDFGREEDSEGSWDEGRSRPINKTFLLDPDCAVQDEELEKTPYLNAPFFREKLPAADDPPVTEDILCFPAFVHVEERIKNAQCLSRVLSIAHERHTLHILSRLVESACLRRVSELLEQSPHAEEQKVFIPGLEQLILKYAEPPAFTTMDRLESIERFLPPRLFENTLGFFRLSPSYLERVSSFIKKKTSPGFPVQVESLFASANREFAVTVSFVLEALFAKGKICCGVFDGRNVILKTRTFFDELIALKMV